MELLQADTNPLFPRSRSRPGAGGRPAGPFSQTPAYLHAAGRLLDCPQPGKDWIDESIFGIDQHSVTSDRVNHNQLGGWSAGCLVGRFFTEHQAFLKLLRTDIRFQANTKYMFMTAVIKGDLLHQTVPDPRLLAPA